jgi:hypothetical protein
MCKKKGATKPTSPISPASYLISDHIHYTDENILKCIPGLDLFAVFVNLELTYEDGMVLSTSAAARFKYNASVSVYLSPHSDTI